MLHTFIAECQSGGRPCLRLVRLAGKADEAAALERVRSFLAERELSPSCIRPVANSTTYADLDGFNLPYMGIYLTLE